MRKMKKIFALVMAVMLLAGSSITAFAQETEKITAIYSYNTGTREVERNEWVNDGRVLTPVTEIEGGGVLWFINDVGLFVDGQQIEAYDNGVYCEYVLPAERCYSVTVGNLEGEYTCIVLTTIAIKTDATTEKVGGRDYAMPHVHDYQWVITVDPTEDADGLSENICKYCSAKNGSQPVSKANAWVEGVKLKIENAPENAMVSVESDTYLCYTDKVMEALRVRCDVSLTTCFTDEEGIKKGFTIPAGQAPDDGEQFYGFIGLGNRYGWLETFHF